MRQLDLGYILSLFILCCFVFHYLYFVDLMVVCLVSC